MIRLGMHAVLDLCYTAGKLYATSQVGQIAFTRLRIARITSALADSLYTKIYDFKCGKEFSQKVCRLLKVPCFETCAERYFHFRNETFGVIDSTIETAEQLGRKWAVSESAQTASYVGEDFFQRTICFDACKASYQPMTNLPYDGTIAGNITTELFLAQFAEDLVETALDRFCDKKTASDLASISVLVGLFTFYQLAPASMALTLFDTGATYSAVKLIDLGLELTIGIPINAFLSYLKKRA
jgi:hypothetical protein